ncbi:MAG: hypothetical protein ABL876_08065 [Chitinophagaceae bacterium]
MPIIKQPRLKLIPFRPRQPITPSNFIKAIVSVVITSLPAPFPGGTCTVTLFELTVINGSVDLTRISGRKKIIRSGRLLPYIFQFLKSPSFPGSSSAISRSYLAVVRLKAKIGMSSEMTTTNIAQLETVSL